MIYLYGSMSSFIVLPKPFDLNYDTKRPMANDLLIFVDVSEFQSRMVR
jgi:hypothetical protein